MNAQQTISDFRAARKGGGGVVVVEGLHAIKHALRFGAGILDIVRVDKAPLTALMQTVVSSDEASIIEERAREVSTELFSSLAPNALRTGIVALARRPDTLSQDTVPDDRKPVVVLDNPRDTENVGAVIRVAAGYGASAVVVLGELQPWNANAIRASAGLHWALPILHNTDIRQIATGRPIIACAADGADMYTTTIPTNTVLVFGSERYGITPTIRALSDRVVRIPMQAHVSSLNLATSVAAVLYGGLQ